MGSHRPGVARWSKCLAKRDSTTTCDNAKHCPTRFQAVRHGARRNRDPNVTIVEDRPVAGHEAARRAMIDSQLRTSGVNDEFVLRRMDAAAPGTAMA